MLKKDKIEIMTLYCWEIKVYWESNGTLRELSKEDKRICWQFEEVQSKRI